jgi:translation initiation factor IF-2
MTETKDSKKKPLSLGSGKLELKGGAGAGSGRGKTTHGRNKSAQVQVEVKRKRVSRPGKAAEAKTAGPKPKTTVQVPTRSTETEAPAAKSRDDGVGPIVLKSIDTQDRAERARELEDARREAAEARARAADEARTRAEAERAAEEERRAADKRVAEEEARKRAEEEARNRAAELARRLQEEEEGGEQEATAARRPGRRQAEEPRRPAPAKRGEPRRRAGRMTVTQALSGDDRRERGRSMAQIKRARQRDRAQGGAEKKEKILRDVTIPDVITVGELANRMAERSADVIKALMANGVMATVNQTIDADTAELIVTEFGHRVNRVSEADVEDVLKTVPDEATDLKARPPVVTIMGHVDHGKTSLLDALRETDVVSREAGGITQHIGAYQVTLESGSKITFIDTPGHAAFTEMRSRGAKVTDIVVLVVAADDGVMPQTIEAINHAKAAEVPLIVAINKMDKQGADPNRVRTELLQHEIQVESMGGEILDVEVSAMKKQGLDKLEEAILLQSELLELKANPDRAAEGVIVEAKLEKGRGPVATVLVQRGTLEKGDAFVAGLEWGRVRAMINDHGDQVDEAGPSVPVEVLGLQGTPSAGDELIVVEDEGRAREISEYRQRQEREKTVGAGRGTLEQMMAQIKEGEARELPVVVKGDVQGSVEAIIGALEKIGNEEVQARVLHAGVGGINESDVTLAGASGGLIIGFNVRANPQARELAKRDGVEIRYYSIIYDVTDDVTNLLTGMLEPVVKERQIGWARVKEVFNISKIGKIAGCEVTEGIVRRGAKVRLLRDDVVIHEGELSSLKRFKDEVKEVQSGMECGLGIANYNDIQVDDVIECFETEEVAATL